MNDFQIEFKAIIDKRLQNRIVVATWIKVLNDVIELKKVSNF